MNCKIFLFSILALLWTVNAAPVEIRSISIDSIRNACELGHSSFFSRTTEDGTENVYGCLKVYDSKKKTKIATPDNSPCFYIYNTAYCVDSRYSNIEHCKTSSTNYNYENCSYDIFSLISSEVTYSQFKTYPEKKRIFNDPVKDQKNCEASRGIVLTYKVMFQYICLVPQSPNHNVRIEHCVTIDEAPYCVKEDYTVIDICNKHSDVYDYDECMKILVEYGRANNINIEKY